MKSASLAEADLSRPLTVMGLRVPSEWIDRNDHMTESRYLDAASRAATEFLDHLGADEDYIATGYSYYAVENHIRYHAEARLGDRLYATIQVLLADAKRLHLFIRLMRGAAEIASVNQMNLHVDARTGRACAAPKSILSRLMPIADAHGHLPRPAIAECPVGQKPPRDGA